MAPGSQCKFYAPSLPSVAHMLVHMYNKTLRLGEWGWNAVASRPDP